MSQVHDPRPCFLGEGPMWHPERQQLFWFDIVGMRLLSQTAEGAPLEWRFDEMVSAAGWLDHNNLMIVSETGFYRFDLDSGERSLLAPLEADRADTRSNDGRADPWGGFWVGTMARDWPQERLPGAIYRFYKGEVRRLFSSITVPNAICFSPDRKQAYYTDTPTQLVMRQPLAADTGWPEGEAEVFLDFRADGLFPDGAVIDADGNFWVAQWGASRVAAYDRQGTYLREVTFDAQHTSCPAFGGPDLTTLFCTTAQEGLDDATLKAQPGNGNVFAAQNAGRGLPEYQVRL